MDAVRCLKCGDTRWTLFSRTHDAGLPHPCEVCGGPTVRERRRPGTSTRAGHAIERRDRARPGRYTRL